MHKTKPANENKHYTLVQVNTLTRRPGKSVILFTAMLPVKTEMPQRQSQLCSGEFGLNCSARE